MYSERTPKSQLYLFVLLRDFAGCLPPRPFCEPSLPTFVIPVRFLGVAIRASPLIKPFELLHMLKPDHLGLFLMATTLSMDYSFHGLLFLHSGSSVPWHFPLTSDRRGSTGAKPPPASRSGLGWRKRAVRSRSNREYVYIYIQRR